MSAYEPRYVPILKGKEGELNALRDVQKSTISNMVPLIELVPRDEDLDPAWVLTTCTNLVDRLATRYTDRVFLDGGLFDLSVPIDGGTTGIVGVLANFARNVLEAQPVVRLGDPPLGIGEAAAAHALDGFGVTIRLSSDEVDEDPDDLEQLLRMTLQDLAIGPEDVDLVLDLGAVDSDVAVRGGARLVASLVRDLPSILDWRSVTVAAGAFPADLGEFTPHVIGERTRFDAHLYDQAHRRPPPRPLDYGDYAIAHPSLAMGAAQFSPPPQLRYTVSDRWLVLKGKRTDPRGHAQFYDICDAIAAHAEFAGARLGRADARIVNSRTDGPGNGSTWRSIGTTHHLDYVVQRLTSLGEP